VKGYFCFDLKFNTKVALILLFLFAFLTCSAEDTLELKEYL